MAIEFYPSSGIPELPWFFGAHVILPGGALIGDRYNAAIVSVQAAFGLAAFDASSATFLLDRIEGFNYRAFQADIDADQLDVYTAIKTGGDRPGSWPSEASDKAAIDAIFASLAP